MTDDYFDNLAIMGVDSIDLFPRATDHIFEMLEMIQQLIKKDHAYPLDGDVYFEVEKDDDYGKLSRRNVSEMMAGTRVEANQRKRNPADFALWKSSKAGEPAWDSPWGPGRPGWHIECSAMSVKYLGESFDIHGGGLDLMFPHHENELAQAESCTGQCFARYWMHNGLMQAGSGSGKVGGGHDRHGDVVVDQAAQEADKLSGSKGAASVKELFAKHRPETVRFFLLNTHYRSPIDFSDENIAQTGKSLEGFYRLFETFHRVTARDFYELQAPTTRDETISLDSCPEALRSELETLRERFVECMDDDFNTGGAVGVLFEMRKCINGHIQTEGLETKASDDQIGSLVAATTLLRELSSLIGVFRRPVDDVAGEDDGFVDDLMKLIIEVRAYSRKEKQFQIADTIRDRLTELNVTLEDRTGETTWRRG